MNFQGEWRRSLAFAAQDFAISVQDEVVLQIAADVGIATSGPDRVIGRRAGFEFEVEIEGESGGVEGWAKVGGGRWKR